MSLTRRQHEILAHIATFIQERGHSPTYAELGELAGVTSTATIHKFVTALRKKRWIARKTNAKAAIRLIRKRNLEQCPVCGSRGEI